MAPARDQAGTMVGITREAGLAALVPPRGFGAQGEATTRPLLLPENCEALTLNLDCRGRGFIQVGLSHANSSDIAGFELGKGMLLSGRNSPAATVFWLTSKHGDGVNAHDTHQTYTSDLRKLRYDASTGLRIRFVIKACSLFAFQFRTAKAMIALDGLR